MSDTMPPDTQPTGEPPICAAARALVGLTEASDAYRTIVDPAGPYAEQVAVAHEASSCMLVAAWLIGWRGRFVADTIQNTLRALWGNSTGRVPDDDNFCDVGAGIWWAESGTAAPEHVDACVLHVERASLYAVTLAVVAGGQRVTWPDIDEHAFPASALGKRCIKQFTRAVQWDGGGWVDQGDGRRVLGVHDP